MVWGFDLIAGKNPHSLELRQIQPALALAFASNPKQDKLAAGSGLLAPCQIRRVRLVQEPLRKRRVGGGLAEPSRLVPSCCQASTPTSGDRVMVGASALLFMEEGNLKSRQAFCPGNAYGRNGRSLGWDSPAPLSLEEARRPISFGVARHTDMLTSCHFSVGSMRIGVHKHVAGKCCCLVMDPSNLNIRVSG